MRSACAPGAPPLAYSACVRLARLNELWGGDEPGFLSQTEWARWSGFPSDKRRLEFAAGRLAAKLVAHATRRSLGWRPLPLRELQVRPDSGGQPWLSAPDAPPLRLAISHAAGVAYAACSPEPVWLGLDVVDRARWLPFDPAIFHSLEADGHDIRVDRSVCFALKEATLKALGCGLDGRTAAVRSVVGPDGQRWVGLPQSVAMQARFVSYTLLHSIERTACVVLAQPNRIS